jgi:hypothetical protein
MSMATRTSAHKYLLRIGSIVGYWSVTELMCDQALAVLLDIETDVARSMTRPGMSFDDRLDVLESVSTRKIEDQALLGEFHAILKKLANASRERDKVVHSVWFNLGYEDMVSTAYSFERGDVPIAGSTKYTPEKLDDVLERLKEATEALTTFLLKRLGMSPAMPSVRIGAP